MTILPPGADHGSAYTGQESFDRRWRQVSPAVEGFLYCLLRDYTAVDDVAQEVAVTAFGQIASYDEQRDFTAWILGIARNKAHEHMRRTSTRRRIVTLAASETLAQVAAELQPEAGVREEALRACLDELPARSGRLVRLHYGEGHALAAVAAEVGVTMANIKVMLHRIRRALRECIERRLAAEGKRR
jgi:RNA polymerase sigma-70 factor (ECF subfamily)